MLDLGWPELFVIVLVALVVLGPKELPGAIRTVTGLVRRARGLAREFYKSIDEMAKETGLDDIKRDLQKAVKSELDDDGLLGDPFAEADKNSILNPTNGSKLPSPKGQPKPSSESKSTQVKPTKSKPAETKSAQAKSTKAKSAQAKSTKAKSTEAKPAQAKPGQSKSAKSKSTKAKPNGSIAKSEVADKPAAGAKPAAPAPTTAAEVAKAKPVPAPEAVQEVAKEDGRA